MPGAVAGAGGVEWGFDCGEHSVGEAGVLLPNDDGGAGGCLRHTGPVTECPRVPEAFLVRERARGEGYFRREYLCEFVETGHYLIDERLVKAAVKPEEEAWRCL